MRIVIFVALCLCYVVSFSQFNHPLNKQDVIIVCDKFMETFNKGKFDEAFDGLKPYSVIEDYKLDTLAVHIKPQITELTVSYGKMVGVEALPEKVVKGVLSRISYVLKFEKSYLRFEFILYNNGGGWTITNFKYNQEVDDLFTGVAGRGL